MVQFNVLLLPPSGGDMQTVPYTAQFANEEGERIVLTKDKRVETELLQEPHTAASLPSQILQDFMAEVSEG